MLFKIYFLFQQLFIKLLNQILKSLSNEIGQLRAQFSLLVTTWKSMWVGDAKEW